ncbi:MAG TPA: beta-propeller domain-containing protein [Rhizomicrobium sp.]|jgi:hypothetical protein|nr:beta-propeller domain-containing protein [Rhizomicrobium sp.]
MRTMTYARRMLLALGLCCAAAASAAAASSLTAFHSEAELRAFLKHLPQRAYPPPPAPPPPAMAADNAVAGAVSVTAQRAAGITNNQEANVDEGDIVKQHGNALVILRRGRLFTVSLAGDRMRPVSSVDAYPPGVDASGDWYDEMLIAGDRIVVIGYSYSRGGTQIDRFRIDGAGHLKFEDAYQLRSNDYYSATNYASRLIGSQLILYSPRYLPYGDGDPLVALPALRRWTPDAAGGGTFERIGTARQVYMAPQLPQDQIAAVHTVTSCDLTSAPLRCTATSVLGPDGRTFYVSEHAVYVWLTPYWGERGPGRRAASLLYRLPLGGGAPSAIGVAGEPVDQFSFREDADDGMLDVLLRGESGGDAMWGPGLASGGVALLRLKLASFGDGLGAAAPARYRVLPTPKGDGDFHNRFVGDDVLYGVGNGWGTPQNASATLIVAPVRGGGAARALALPHGVDRIEVMGQDAVVVGSDASNVYFSAVTLRGAPALGDRYVMTGAAQAETRSHGFFFRPDEGSRDSSGVLGLPVSRPAAPAWRQLIETSAAMVYLRRSGGRFAPLGEIEAGTGGLADDRCVASCTDWYGNARPIFIGDRAFALLGYELVEGALDRRAIREVGRVSFAPR